jgi:broad specificity phosphatase PhoE
MAKPTNIFLIRHGESEGNVDKSVYEKIPDYAIPLTELGRQQARDCGKWLDVNFGANGFFFYVSPFRRTRQTFEEIIAGSNFWFDYREDPRLREQEWTTRVKGYDMNEELERASFGHFYYRFGGGENCADVFDRCSDFLDTLFRDFEKSRFPPNCAIVSHGMAIRVLLMRWFHLTVEEFEALRNPKNASVIRLQLEPSAWGKKDRYRLVTELGRYESQDHNYQFPIVLPRPKGRRIV